MSRARPSRVVLVALTVLAGAGGACTQSAAELLPPRGQAIVHFDTDAPLPSTDATRPPPLFDRLRVDVYACSTCAPSSHDFAVDTEEILADELSIGVVPRAPGDSVIVRARLFLANAISGEEPPAEISIDVTAVTPAIPAEGLVDLTLFLPTDSVATSVGSLDAPVAMVAGTPKTLGPRVGTWKPAQRVDCAEPPGDGEVCVPGGAYWKGSGQLEDFGFTFDADAGARRLVVISPFYFDAHEATVAEFRATKTPVDKYWSGSMAGASEEDWCTGTRAPGPHDDLPQNCITWQHARAFCQARGMDLATEGQWEYVASNLRGWPWPWGNSVPTCADAVLGRGLNIFTDDFNSDECRAPPRVDAPKVAGTGARDHVDLPGRFGGTVYDMVGNLAEFTRDVYQHLDDECWVRQGIYVDPTCDTFGKTTPGRTYKGGVWEYLPAVSFAALRWPASTAGSVDTWTGARCVRPADPFIP